MQITQKRFDGEQEKSIDRLPDEILVHILSFMSSTRCCVRSSILGKRWRFLWARVPNLKFESWEHNSLTSFINFFNRFVFIHKGQTINSFSIASREKEFKFEIEKMIATAIACNVQVIEIISDFGLMLPQCIFTCKFLVDMMLGCICENKVPMTGTTVCLPALKKLELRGLRYESEESLVHLLTGCPVLEELTISITDTNLWCVYVYSPTLTRLDLKIPFDQYDDRAYVDGKIFEVKLNTPALKYLKLHDYLSDDFSAGMLASLTEADVVSNRTHSVSEFVGNLYNVSRLKLKTCSMDAPDSALTTKFHNLTTLEFAGNWRFVTYFLENSDNLEVLTINMVDSYRWMEPKQVPMCMIYHLGTVRIFNFKCLEPEFNMVEYILRNAKVLKMMKINVCYYHRDSERKHEALKRISSCERASVACQFVVD